MKKQVPDSPMGKLASFLGADLKTRWFKVLESRLLAGDAVGAGNLLEHWGAFWIEKKEYPQGSGKKLRRLVQSIPPSIRLRKLTGPLLPVGVCIQLSAYACTRDFDDVLEFYRGICSAASEPELLKVSRAARKSWSSTYEIVVAELQQDHLAKTIGLSTDEARASFTLDSVIVGSSLQAIEVITSFCIHLWRHSQNTDDTLPFDQAGPEAYALLDRSFSREGGAPVALAEAQSGVQGGLRFVLDRMTEQFKRESQDKYVHYVISTAIDPLKWETKVTFMKALLARCAYLLPPEVRSQPAERFVKNFHPIVRAYVSSLDALKQLLRTI